ncbi:hypothetical protein FC48_GL000955 [Ligilactobacillus murinus DSM 20452 = NBRC 14221]|uniref:DUF1642 domain-containing protein n=1 Tax=Ligilactobacillus murinus DSM 20452 = NBRC 14221 TaxID=1423772 RepID=A0A0R2BDA4_9LACO|nr:DUF1642 domain-containing protein [Ligilactobacillus murinus]KRM73683.1 hypothetical protein FC48_GL000955 [Ligilactobacillus murinus DSM 20452 = NBRC 14221]
MEEQKLVLQDGTYKYDDRTRQVSVSEEQSKKAGYVKLADDEQIVKKAVLSKEEAEWFEKYKDLPFYERTSSNYFISKLFYKLSRFRGWEKRADFFNRLSQAYFTGYTIKKEKKYYIRLNFNRGPVYLNVNKKTGNWFFETRSETSSYKTQFTQEKINEMQKDPRAKGLDLNVLKVEVPEDKLED